MEWHSIDDPEHPAPRDGTQFQAWCVHDDGRGWWEPRARFRPDEEVFEFWGRIDYDAEGWDTLHWSSKPTHWQPLPAPPED